jgi:adenosylhomocysteine nucleosidase
LILVFYAFAREIAPFKRRVRNRTLLALEGLHGFRARIGGKDFAFVGHGIGHQRATETARRAFDSMPKAELVIGTGVAGALSRGLKPGDLVLSDRVLMIHADGEQSRPGAAVSAAHVRAIGHSLANAGIAYSTGAILTSNRVFTVPEKRGAKESTGAIAVDMESAAIASEAAVRGLPFVAIRAVLDEVDDEVVGAEMADEDGDVSPLAATAYLLRNPATVLKLPRMMRNLSRATAAIADALSAIAHDGKTPDVVRRDRAREARKRPR